MSTVYKYIIKIGSVVLIVALIVILIITTIRQKREIQRVKDNLEVQLREDFSKEQEITKQELKKYYSGIIDSLKHVADVKPKQIEHIVQVRYNYVDSTIYTDSLIYIYDTITNKEGYKFAVETKCNYLEGKVFVPDSIILDKVEYRDNITMVLYKGKFRFFKPREYRACAISSCQNDTIAVSNNLHVIKRGKKR